MIPSISLSDLVNDFTRVLYPAETVYGSLGYDVYRAAFDLFGASIQTYENLTLLFITLTMILLIRKSFLAFMVYLALCVFNSPTLNLMHPYSLSGLVQSFLLICLVSTDNLWIKRALVFLICLGKVEIALAVILFTGAFWATPLLLFSISKVVISLEPMSLMYPIKIFLVSVGGIWAPVLALIQKGPDLTHALQMLLLVLMLWPFNWLGILLHLRMLFNQGSQAIFTMHLSPLKIQNKWQRAGIAALCALIISKNLPTYQESIQYGTPYGWIEISNDAYGQDMLDAADFIKAHPGAIWSGPNMDIYFLTGREPVAEKGYIPFLNHLKADGGQSDRDTIEAIKGVKYVVIDKFKHKETGWLPLTNRYAREQKRVFENEHFFVAEIL